MLGEDRRDDVVEGGLDQKVDVAHLLGKAIERTQQQRPDAGATGGTPDIHDASGPRRPTGRQPDRWPPIRHIMRRLRSRPRRSLPPFPQPSGRPREPRLSIIVNNHNYARYLDIALESALGQEGADVEVIAVDDGSTDGSREIIARHRERLRVVLQENLGQKAAFNAGFAAATGDIVMFLDSDDLLEHGTAARVVDAFRRDPGCARVVFRLAVVDGDGRATGACLPSAHMRLPQGDVRSELLAFPDDLAWPPTSGNAFASWALRHVMPLPVDDARTGGDHDLHTLVPLYGPVSVLTGIGGSYRVHGRNAQARHRLDVVRSRVILQQTERSHTALVHRAELLGYGRARPRSVTAAAHRLISVRLGGPGHPIPGDTRWRALAAGLLAAWGRVDVGVGRRAAYSGWFLAATLGPARAMRILADRAFQSTRSR
jgi:hypothetical protein